MRNALGEEHLGALLDLTLERTKELADGFNFSDELAHHVESMLGLPSGFIDQANPVLTEQEVARLKQPLPDGKPMDESSEEPAPLRLAGAQDTEKDQPELKELSMTATAQSQQESQQPATQEDALRLVRRNNLALLTSRPGSKSQLAKLTGLSAANISHRLHGNKIFDADTGKFFSQKLGLPTTWFETTKTEEDVSAATWKLLGVGALAAGNAPAAKKRRPGKKTAAPASAAAGASASDATGAPAARRRGRPPLKKVGIPSGLAPVRSGTSKTAPAPVPTAARSKSPAPPRAQAPVTARSAAAVARGSAAEAAIQGVGGGVGPIATALLHTLAAKARSGALSEDRALSMLTEIATV